MFSMMAYSIEKRLLNRVLTNRSTSHRIGLNWNRVLWLTLAIDWYLLGVSSRLLNQLLLIWISWLAINIRLLIVLLLLLLLLLCCIYRKLGVCSRLLHSSIQSSVLVFLVSLESIHIFHFFLN